MREILFRGKRLDDGEWVEGYYLSDCARHAIAVSHSLVQGWELHEVGPATVGQFTGLTDKNGKKIFEGDKVQLTILDEDSCCGRTYTESFAIIWSGRKKSFELHDGKEYCLGDYRGSHRPDITYITDSAMSCLIQDVEIIGNIHDNPELLGGAE